MGVGYKLGGGWKLVLGVGRFRVPSKCRYYEILKIRRRLLPCLSEIKKRGDEIVSIPSFFGTWYLC